MNPVSTIIAIARDVLREAASSKLLLVLFVLIGLFLLMLVMTLNLDVVDGALASVEIAKQGGEATTVDAMMREAFGQLAWVTFYMGLLFGIVATADVAPRALQPGRVEHLLALPVRRVEFVIGLYVGVCAICAICTTTVVGGTSLVLFVKAGMVTIAPLAGAAMAFVGFCAIYAVMLAVGVFARSAALSAGAGLLTFFMGIVVGYKHRWIELFTGAFRTGLDVLTMPIPNLVALAGVGQNAAAGAAIDLATLAPLLAGTVAFAVVGVAVAAVIVDARDY